MPAFIFTPEMVKLCAVEAVPKQVEKVVVVPVSVIVAGGFTPYTNQPKDELGAVVDVSVVDTLGINKFVAVGVAAFRVV